MTVQGHYDPAFKTIRDVFEQNFVERGEVGASVCLRDTKGRVLVDLWGGSHPDGQTAWTRDTTSVIFSCTKAATALCAHILIDRGELDPDALVTKYWPEFGVNGKDKTTVRDMLAHRSGVPALREPVKAGGFLDFDYMAQRLAGETPFWDPGTTHGYHLVSFGWTVGELIRRVSGKSLGQFFKDEIAAPYGVDFHIGLPTSEFGRVSKLIVYKADSPESWRAEIGGAGGISNARGLAAMFGCLFGKAPLLSHGRINFGHVGMGGSIGFADPEAGFAFGYSMNKMGGGILLNTRGQSLVDAAYSCF